MSNLSYKRQVKEVIIVGSGISGISCARYLADHTNLAITILEANSERYGGRIWSYEPPGYPGKFVEFGAMWVHEGSNFKHPLHSIINNFNIQNNDVGDLRFIHCFNNAGQRYSATDLKFLTQVPEKLKILKNEIISKKLPDISLEEAIENIDEAHDRRVRHFFTPFWECYHGSTKEKISLLYADGLPNCPETVECPGTDVVITDGYRKVLDHLVVSGRMFKICLGCQVTNISFNNGSKVKIECNNSNMKYTYEADHVVITVPLSILKSGCINFQPGLPHSFSSAVERIGIDNKLKVLIIFDRIFWPKEEGCFAYEDSNPTGFPLIVLNMYKIDKLPALLAYISGEGANVAATMTEDQILNRVRKCLATMFGKDAIDNTQIVFTKIVNWTEQPFIHGAYSFTQIGMKPEDAYNIRQPIRPYLYFAGEHTAVPEGLHGSASGAYLSGIRAAKEIVVDCQQENILQENYHLLKCRL